MSEYFHLNSKIKILSLLLFFLGILNLAYFYFLIPDDHHQRFWSNILVNNYYFTGIALGALFFISIQYATNAGWSVLIQRIPESLTSFLPVSAFLMLIFSLLGIHSVYHWSHPTNDPIILSKTPYLNTPAFILRTLLYFLIWIPFAWIIKKNSTKQDILQNHRFFFLNRKIAYVFLALFALSITFANFDWIMSLDSHWFSTMFGIYGFAGSFVQALATITIVTIILKKQQYLKSVNQNHLHDLGRYLFAFSTFWIYIWFFQFMLIWYSNIPEETLYYIPRIQQPWLSILIATLILNWVLPFFILISRPAKRNPTILFFVSILLFIGHWIDTYLKVFPSTIKNYHFGIFEITTFLGYLGLFIFVFTSSLSKSFIAPQTHPLLKESIHYHT